MPKYRIQSAQTHLFVISTGLEKVGQRVVTSPIFDPHATILFIDPEIHGATSRAVVTGKKGLHIAVHEEEQGEYLIWSDKKYVWDFATNGPPGTHSVYVNGKDLYWFEEAETKHFITLQPGRNAKENEIFFRLQEL